MNRLNKVLLISTDVREPAKLCIPNLAVPATEFASAVTDRSDEVAGAGTESERDSLTVASGWGARGTLYKRIGECISERVSERVRE